MSMKKFNLMMWQGLVLSALALGFASCEPSDTPCPNKKEANSTTDQGVTVMLEMENVETGETTRTALGESNYSFTPKGEGGDVQALGLGFKRKLTGTDDIDVKLTYYAKENVVFQGWSWRYAEDPKGTHRGKTEEIIKEYVEAPALQTAAGIQKLDLGEDITRFTCKYRQDRDNRVFVKVKYTVSKEPLRKMPPRIEIGIIDEVLGDMYSYNRAFDLEPLKGEREYYEAQEARAKFYAAMLRNDTNYSVATHFISKGWAFPSEWLYYNWIYFDSGEMGPQKKVNYSYYGVASYVLYYRKDIIPLLEDLYNKHKAYYSEIDRLYKLISSGSVRVGTVTLGKLNFERNWLKSIDSELSSILNQLVQDYPTNPKLNLYAWKKEMEFYRKKGVLN